MQSTHPAPTSAAIEIVALTKRYAQGKPAVDAINLRIASGSYCCLLGPSGCGKSTTLRMIAGHESVTSGDILLENRNITGLPAAARGTAMMFQSFALFPHLSALDNVAFSLKMKGVAKAERRPRRATCWSAWRWVICLNVYLPNSRVGSSSVWRWPVPSSPSRGYCCSMNRFRPSTPSCASRCVPSCAAGKRSWA